jgi:Glycosyl-hydrolase 97 N-terminal
VNRERRSLTNRFTLEMISVFGAVLMAIEPHATAQAQNDVSDGQVSVKSPDGTIDITIRGNGLVSYSVSVDGKVVLTNSRLGLKFKGGVTLGDKARLVKVERSHTDTSWENRFGKRRTVLEEELRSIAQMRLITGWISGLQQVESTHCQLRSVLCHII